MCWDEKAWVACRPNRLNVTNRYSAKTWLLRNAPATATPATKIGVSSVVAIGLRGGGRVRHVAPEHEQLAPLGGMGAAVVGQVEILVPQGGRRWSRAALASPSW